MELLDRLRAHLATKYEIVGEIGRGGSSIVFRARDLQDGSSVAIKVLAADLSEHVRPVRFLREISIASTLVHPNILPLLDSGDAEGLLYYVMPFAEGETLRERIDRSGPLAVDEALAVVRAVAQGLAYAHERKVVHRDVKPSNILEYDGRMVIADFGVAQAVDHASDGYRTSTGLVPGTPTYMSPEQAGGSPVDARSDIYALGCVLFEMLAGEPPFTGRTVQTVVARHLSERPPSLEVVRPGTPPGIADVVERSLAKVAADRYPDMAAFVAALDKGLTAPARRAPRRTVRRALIALGGLAVLGVALWQGGFGARAGPADDRRIVVFPLQDPGGGLSGEDGWDVALAVGTALEHTEPLRWLDGWLWLPTDVRADMSLLTADLATTIARDQSAAHYVTGAIRRTADSAWVTLHLVSPDGGEVARESAVGPRGAPLYQVALAALPPLLSSLLEPGREVDLTPLTRADPAAVALTIQGDRAYRRSDFSTAYGFYSRAVGADSLLAIAAARGAAAAIWEEEDQDALRLAGLAVRNDSVLPERHRFFIRGVEAYLDGRADTAVALLERALERDPDWSEAGAVLGEVYYHLFPASADLTADARRAFEQVVASDSAFTPPLSHLAQMDIRRGDFDIAGTRIRRLAASLGESARLVQVLHLMSACARSELDADADLWAPEDWRAKSDGDPRVILDAAQALAVGGAWPRCARTAFAALHDAGSAYAWVSALGQESLLLAQGRVTEARTLLDSLMPDHRGGAYSLYLLGSVLSPAFDSLAETLARTARDADYRRYRIDNLWLLGVWHTVQGQASQVAHLERLVDSLATVQGGRKGRILAAALAADALFAAGRTAEALEGFKALRATAPLHSYYWELDEPLAPERILQARALLAAGDHEGAIRVASLFDHPSPILYVAFLGPSLAIRARAAEALGRRAAAEEYRTRLVRLGWPNGEVPLSLSGPLLYPSSLLEVS